MFVKDIVRQTDLEKTELIFILTGVCNENIRHYN